jgi:hypothetical protein
MYSWCRDNEPHTLKSVQATFCNTDSKVISRLYYLMFPKVSDLMFPDLPPSPTLDRRSQWVTVKRSNLRELIEAAGELADQLNDYPTEYTTRINAALKPFKGEL